LSICGTGRLVKMRLIEVGLRLPRSTSCFIKASFMPSISSTASATQYAFGRRSRASPTSRHSYSIQTPSTVLPPSTYSASLSCKAGLYSSNCDAQSLIKLSGVRLVSMICRKKKKSAGTFGSASAILLAVIAAHTDLPTPGIPLIHKVSISSNWDSVSVLAACFKSATFRGLPIYKHLERFK
jgi:hypothetical protein